MKVKLDRKYRSKLLLFGEYTIISGSEGLAIPLNLFSGQYDNARKSDILYPLDGIVDFLIDSKFSFQIETGKFKEDVDNGLFFNSNIPIGYGLGSSGALTAAIYDKYVVSPAQELGQLKKELSEIEACFHGESSGIDPLISYLDQSVLMHSKTDLEQLSSIPSLDNIFLIDTHISRQTSPLVKIFLEKCKDMHYQKQCEEILIPFVDDAIDAFLKEKYPVLFDSVHQISFFQYKYFEEMIPTAFKKLWLEGLSSDQFKLKLCGAGGGGFIIGVGDYKAIHNYEQYSILTL